MMLSEKTERTAFQGGLCGFQKPHSAAIVQARMGSSRLPGKMMMDLCGRPVLKWVLERLKLSALLDSIIVATSDKRIDDPIEAMAEQAGVPSFRGDEQNVLKRFVDAARQYEVTYVIRVCADNPLIAPEEVDRLIEFYFKETPDYAFNHIPYFNNQYPDGLGAEILSARLLERLHESATLDAHKEHLTSYIWDHSDRFTIKTMRCPKPYNIPEMKLDVDTKEDLNRLRRVCEGLEFASSPETIARNWKVSRS